MKAFLNILVSKILLSPIRAKIKCPKALPSLKSSMGTLRDLGFRVLNHTGAYEEFTNIGTEGHGIKAKERKEPRRSP